VVAVKDLRQLPPSLDHWYAVATNAELRKQLLSVTLWEKDIILFRSPTGEVRALEDRCPHRLVKLSGGSLKGDQLECPYHGWRFAADGQCLHVPGMKPDDFRYCKIQSYPVLERYGFIWIFPGRVKMATQREPIAIPEWEHLNQIGSIAPMHCTAHFSYVIENLMDMHHSHLHRASQAWSDAELEKIEEHPDRVDAYYQATNYYKIDQIWSAAQLFIPALRQPHRSPLVNHYFYPHWRTTLGKDFTLYCLICPVNKTQTRSWMVHFTSLEAFPALHRLPKVIRHTVKKSLTHSARPLLKKLAQEDMSMMVQEQQAYQQEPERRYWQTNRTLAAVQRVIRGQAMAHPKSN